MDVIPLFLVALVLPVATERVGQEAVPATSGVPATRAVPAATMAVSSSAIGQFSKEQCQSLPDTVASLDPEELSLCCFVWELGCDIPVAKAKGKGINGYYTKFESMSDLYDKCEVSASESLPVGTIHDCCALQHLDGYCNIPVSMTKPPTYAVRKPSLTPKPNDMTKPPRSPIWPEPKPLHPPKGMPKSGWHHFFRGESKYHCRGRHDRRRGARGKGKWAPPDFTPPPPGGMLTDKLNRARWERALRMWQDKGLWRRFPISQEMISLWAAAQKHERMPYVIGIITQQVERPECGGANCTVAEVLSDMAEKVYALFPEDQAPYNKSWSEMKDKLDAALNAKFGDMLWTESIARARLGIAIHLAKWGGLVRTATAAAAAASKQARDEREAALRPPKGLGPPPKSLEKAPDLSQWPHPELSGLTLEQMVAAMKRRFGEEFESVEMWKKWLMREKKLGEWVQMKSKMAKELEDEGIEGPSTKQASTMLLRCLDASEPRDLLEEDVCQEAYNYTESCLECEQEEQTWLEEVVDIANRPLWMWVLLALLLIATLTSLALLYICRCRGRAALNRQSKKIAAKLSENTSAEKPAWTS